MMNTIVNENLISFKELEQNIFSYVCELGREMTKILLESYDKQLAESRDKAVYRDKGSRQTSIKTVYGTGEYSRKVYRTVNEEGQAAHVFLLDQSMHMDKIGLVSTNLAEKIALTVTEVCLMKEKWMRCWSISRPMQPVSRAQKQKINQAKRQGSYINIRVITKKVCCHITRGGLQSQNQKKALCIRVWGYRKVRIVL